MSPRLRAEIEAQLEQMRRLAADFSPTARTALAQPPQKIEVAALAAMLHAFYTGVENVLKRIAVEYEALPNAGADWHTLLLANAARAHDRRPAILDATLVERLKPYLQFRHVFRHAYTFDLQWEKMRPMVHDFELVHGQVEHALRAFVASMEPRS